MIRLALVGKNIAHSKSASMYEKIYNQKIDYALLDFFEGSEIPCAEKLLKDYQGISITAPYKSHFLLEVEVDDKFKVLNAINCLYLNNNKIYGTNTDFLAIERIIFENNYLNKDIVVLGNGAMFRVLQYILNEREKKFIHYYRKKDGDLSNIELSKNSNLLVINACSRSFNFSGKINEDAIFWDLNYSHEFHLSSLTKKTKYVDGIDLLFEQAKFATQFWKINPL